MKNRAAWLALTVVAVASLLMAFVIMPRLNHGVQPIGDAINAAGTAVKDAVNDPTPKQAAKQPDAQKPAEQAAASTAPQPSATAAQAPAPQAAQPATKTPSFDVLRVEPDGSTVIAGRAEPHSKLEVTDGSGVVAKVDVGASGDFAAILDNPLPPGDHQLVLKATGKDGKATLSEETATVSVPANQKNGKLLAMVTTPGKASRLIATPTQNPNPTTAPVPAPAPNQTAAAAPQAPASTPTAAPAAATDASGQASLAGLPALPAGSAGLAASAPNMASATPQAPTAPSAAPVSAPAAAAGPITPAPELRVTAVELEGSKIFIAGTSKPGLTLRGQADGKPIGQAQAGADGTFVIQGQTELSVGYHRIGVDALGSGGQVLVRVEVPFHRPAGDQVAAVAAAPAGMTNLDDATFDKLRTDTVRAFNLLRGLYDGGKVPSQEQMVAGRSATAIALRSLSEYRLPADAAAASRMIAETTSKDAATALAALEALPKDVTIMGANLQKIGQMIAKAVGPVIARELKGIEVASAAANGAAPTIQQEALTQSDRNSVIIRRGDTLWQISRRVYGQGVRYTTIYLANEAQINNPDVIQPGQILGVPGEYRPDSEQIHRDRLMHKRS